MDLDVTFLFQLGIFLVCLVGLNGLILKPFLAVIQEREAKTEGAREEVATLTTLGDADREKYQARIRKARVEADLARDELRNEGRERERELLAKVRAEIADTLNAARQEVDEAEQRARRGLSGDTNALAQQLVSKVLGRNVAA